MASPQKENGYTPIANELWEAFIRIRIPGEVRQIIDFIIRKTYGFGKKEDFIPLSQFCDATKQKKSNVCRNLKKAVKMGIIIKSDNGIITRDNGICLSYSINKNYEEWRPLSPVITRYQKPHKSLSHVSTSKDNTKENINTINNTPKKPRKTAGNGKQAKQLFRDSEYFNNFEKFAEKLPEWEKGKITHFFQAAIDWSESKLGKSANWISSVKNWDRMRPDEWKKSTKEEDRWKKNIF